MCTLTPQKGHGLDAVRDHVEMDGGMDRAESFVREPDIHRDCLRPGELLLTYVSYPPLAFMVFLSPSARAKRKVEPCPGCDSTEMLPPWRSTIFLQMASPMPVPANSSRLCRRWNMPKILSKYCESIPSPLSLTENTHFFAPFLAAETCTRGTPGLWYLMALPTRF